jgi:hypothetical protein
LELRRTLHLPQVLVVLFTFTGKAEVTALWIYPIKGCRGTRVERLSFDAIGYVVKVEVGAGCFLVAAGCFGGWRPLLVAVEWLGGSSLRTFIVVGFVDCGDW